MPPDLSIIHEAMFKKDTLPVAYVFACEERFASWANYLVGNRWGIFISKKSDVPNTAKPNTITRRMARIHQGDKFPLSGSFARGLVAWGSTCTLAMFRMNRSFYRGLTIGSAREKGKEVFCRAILHRRYGHLT